MRKFLEQVIITIGFKNGMGLLCTAGYEAQQGLSISGDVTMEKATQLYNQSKSMVVKRRAASTPARF
jgi:hypothetical protein